MYLDILKENISNAKKRSNYKCIWHRNYLAISCAFSFLPNFHPYSADISSFVGVIHQQKKMVQVHKFICKGTLEERIDLMIEKKQQLASDIISNTEQWITKLSNDDLEALVTLDPHSF